jgi:hypothetical protein
MLYIMGNSIKVNIRLFSLLRLIPLSAYLKRYERSNFIHFKPGGTVRDEAFLNTTWQLSYQGHGLRIFLSFYHFSIPGSQFFS